MRNCIVIVMAVPAAIWNAVVSWFMKVITPDSAVRLPSVNLAPEMGEAVRTDLPGQVVRL
ncbi:hypothetical protein ABZV77_06815 [Streptomyces sp. NPDC004732]|uniref:hypothetical protein n=1 Tax=Streptomyces sp. NPDC004732 TaxID=3154290 RepID=UPI0033BD1555